MISEPAADLVFSTPPPATIGANDDFTVAVAIQDKNGATLTSGIDSTAQLTLQIAYFENLVLHFVAKPFENMVSTVNVSLISMLSCT